MALFFERFLRLAGQQLEGARERKIASITGPDGRRWLDAAPMPPGCMHGGLKDPAVQSARVTVCVNVTAAGVRSGVSIRPEQGKRRQVGAANVPSQHPPQQTQDVESMLV